MTSLCLIVDDSTVTRLVSRQIVEAFGFECVEAADGIKAVTACRARMPHVILLDWNMPNLPGYECMMHIRRLDGGDRPVIIFCTAEHDTSRMQAALNHGANEYIIKPFGPDVIRDKFLLTGLLHD